MIPGMTTEDTSWAFAARRVVRELAARPLTFTTDDVWARLDGVVEDTPRDRRAMGLVIKAAAAEGLIEHTGRWVKSERSECHGRPVAVWRPRAGQWPTKREQMIAAIVACLHPGEQLSDRQIAARLGEDPSEIASYRLAAEKRRLLVRAGKVDDEHGRQVFTFRLP